MSVDFREFIQVAGVIDQAEADMRAPRPVILAGGLHAGNVRAAILEVRPAGVDAHTGLGDSSGRKGEEKVRKFMAEAQDAFRRILHAA